MSKKLHVVIKLNVFSNQQGGIHTMFKVLSERWVPDTGLVSVSAELAAC